MGKVKTQTVTFRFRATLMDCLRGIAEREEKSINAVAGELLKKAILAEEQGETGRRKAAELVAKLTALEVKKLLSREQVGGQNDVAIAAAVAAYGMVRGLLLEGKFSPEKITKSVEDNYERPMLGGVTLKEKFNIK